jgi:hypothetical protein
MKCTVHHPNRSAWRPVLAALWVLHAAAAFALEETEGAPVPSAGTADEVEVVGRSQQSPSLPKTFGSSDIKDWYAPDSQTLIINTYAHGRFKATLTGACTGIRSAETLGFTTTGPYELDRSTTVVLPDGARCGFSDLIAVPVEETAPRQNGD